jgi:hypothetical protein
MRSLVIASAMIVLAAAPAMAAEEPTATVLRIENGSHMTHLLIAIDSDTAYNYARFSCVLSFKNEPVFEGGAFVERIQNGRTINRAGLLYKGKIDQASCRLLQTGAAR